MLHHIPDADNPAGFIAAYVDAVCPDSYVPVAHTGDDEALATGLVTFHNGYHIPVPLPTFRNPTQITGFFDELNLVEPGIVPISLRHPEPDEDLSAHPEISRRIADLVKNRNLPNGDGGRPLIVRHPVSSAEPR
jgi:S-adenosyl methyltransferase